MYEKNAPAGAKQKPILKYSLEDKNINPIIIRTEQDFIVNCFFYGSFPQLEREFAIERHRFLYSSLQSFCYNYPQDQWTCNNLIQYLQETKVINNCGGVEYVSMLFKNT